MVRRATLLLAVVAAGCFVFPSCTCGMDMSSPSVDASRPRGKLPPLPRAGGPLRIRPPMSGQPSALPAPSAQPSEMPVPSAQ